MIIYSISAGTLVIDAIITLLLAFSIDFTNRHHNPKYDIKNTKDRARLWKVRINAFILCFAVCALIYDADIEWRLLCALALSPFSALFAWAVGREYQDLFFKKDGE